MLKVKKAIRATKVTKVIQEHLVLMEKMALALLVVMAHQLLKQEKMVTHILI